MVVTRIARLAAGALLVEITLYKITAVKERNAVRIGIVIAIVIKTIIAGGKVQQIIVDAC